MGKRAKAARKPPQPEPADAEREPSPGRRSWIAVALAAALVVWAAFGGAVYGLAHYGEAAIAGLENRVADTVLAEGQALRRAGETEAALAAYEKALAQGFRSDQQGYYAQREYGDFLAELERWDAAAAAYRVCIGRDPDDPKAHLGLTGALLAQQDYPALEAAATDWARAAAASGDPANTALAQYRKGLALEEQGDTEAALAAYLEGHEADPTHFNAYHAALLLESMGRPDEARPLLETYIQHGAGPRLQHARELLGE